MKFSQGRRVFALTAVATLSVMASFGQAPAPSPAPAQSGDQSGSPASQPPTPTPPAPTALSTPAVTGPLSNLPPAVFDAGPLGKIAVNGILDGMGSWTGNHVPGDNTTQAALSNGQVFLQKTDGWFQFYLQAGAYNIPALGTPFPCHR